jgi:hypothetical protein
MCIAPNLALHGAERFPLLAPLPQQPHCQAGDRPSFGDKFQGLNALSDSRSKALGTTGSNSQTTPELLSY